MEATRPHSAAHHLVISGLLRVSLSPAFSLFPESLSIIPAGALTVGGSADPHACLRCIYLTRASASTPRAAGARQAGGAVRCARARARHESKEAREVARRSLRAPIQGAARDLCGGRKGEQASPERECVQCVAAPSAAESRRTLRCAHSGRCVRRARQPASCHARSATHALHRRQQPAVSASCVVL